MFNLSPIDSIRFGLIALELSESDYAVSWISEGIKRLPKTILNEKFILSELIINYDKTMDDFKIMINNVRYELSFGLKSIENNDYKIINKYFHPKYRSKPPTLCTSSDRTCKEEARLCRNENLKTKQVHKLSCYYMNTNLNPLFMLIHVKVEEKYKDPDIIQIYDVLYDYEIEHLKNMSVHDLEPTLTCTDKCKVDLNSIISTSVDIHHLDRIVDKILKKTSILANLGCQVTELLKISHYGVGGFNRYKIIRQYIALT